MQCRTDHDVGHPAILLSGIPSPRTLRCEPAGHHRARQLLDRASPDPARRSLLGSGKATSHTHRSRIQRRVSSSDQPERPANSGFNSPLARQFLHDQVPEARVHRVQRRVEGQHLSSQHRPPRLISPNAQVHEPLLAVATSVNQPGERTSSANRLCTFEQRLQSAPGKLRSCKCLPLYVECSWTFRIPGKRDDIWPG